jgi:hypothetical protein
VTQEEIRVALKEVAEKSSASAPGSSDLASSAFTNDPFGWFEWAKPMVEDKNQGLVPFIPRDYQVPLIQALHDREWFILEKPPQYGATTAAAMYLAYALLHWRPLHADVVSQDEDVMMRRIMRPVQIALESAKLTEAQRSRLKIGGEHREQYEYATEWSVNRIRGHAPTIRAMHGSDGNFVLMDEVARMPNVEGVYKRATRMLPDAGGLLAMMSTHNGAGTFFCQCCDNAEELGLRRMRWNWRVDPARDDEWYAAELSKAIAAGMESEFHEEMDLTVRVSADELFDLRGMASRAATVRWVGPDRQVGHRYLKAFDLHQSSRAGSAKTVCYVMDTTVRPGQVVFREELKVKTGGDQTVTEQKLDFIAKLDAMFPGDVYLDITNDKATAELARVKGRKFGFRFTADHLKPKREWDATGKMWLVSGSRRTVQSNAVGMTGTGGVVAHLKQFSELEIGLRTAHDSEPGQHNAKMRQGGRCVDDLDCFLMLCWGMRGLSVYDGDHKPQTAAPKREEQGRKLDAPRFTYQLKRVF